MIKNTKGFLLVEIVIAVALISIAFIALLGIGLLTLNVSNSVNKQTQADFLIKEEFEALRNFRDGTSWSTNGLGVVNTGIGNPYHLAIVSNKWAIVAEQEVSGSFTKKIIFDKVSRDVNNNIEEIYNASGDDPDTIKVTATVAWSNKILTSIMYLTNWK